jgi:tetratricopeptide (TPR) repeat protein
VARCAPCSDALSALQTQRDALQYLSVGETDDAAAAVAPGRTAIEEILSATARTGREKLADLLYELAKACLIVLPDLKRRIERKAEPREAPIVAGELRTINSRLEANWAAVPLDGVPERTPEEARALGAADACLRILENVEGSTERQQLAWSQVLLFQGHPAEAERVLGRLLRTEQLLRYRELAQRNLMLSMIRQGKYAAAAESGEAALHERPDDAVVLFNLTVSYAHLVDHAAFDRVSSALARVIADGDPAWLVQLVRYEIPRIAGDLQVAQARVEQTLGVLAGESSGRQ